MTLSLTEIKQRRVEALKCYAENLVLHSWYDMLAFALERAGMEDVASLDLSRHYILGDQDLVWAIKSYYDAAAIEYERPDWKDEKKGRKAQDKLVTDYVSQVLDGQLAELGVTPRRVTVYAGMDVGYWIFMLKPGQEPVLNPDR